MRRPWRGRGHAGLALQGLEVRPVDRTARHLLDVLRHLCRNRLRDAALRRAESPFSRAVPVPPQIIRQ